MNANATVPRAVHGCAECTKLVVMLGDAVRSFDYTKQADARVLIRRHHGEKHNAR